jgi:hypothetical protein
MQSQGIPKEIAGIIQASIVLFVAMQFGISAMLDRLGGLRQSKKASGTAEPSADTAGTTPGVSKPVTDSIQKNQASRSGDTKTRSTGATRGRKGR